MLKKQSSHKYPSRHFFNKKYFLKISTVHAFLWNNKICNISLSISLVLTLNPLEIEISYNMTLETIQHKDVQKISQLQILNHIHVNLNNLNEKHDFIQFFCAVKPIYFITSIVHSDDVKSGKTRQPWHLNGINWTTYKSQNNVDLNQLKFWFTHHCSL